LQTALTGKAEPRVGRCRTRFARAFDLAQVLPQRIAKYVDAERTAASRFSGSTT